MARPVDRLEMPLVAVLRPDEVEVDKLLTLLSVELSPVDRLEMLLVAVLRPDDVDVDKLPMLLAVVLNPVLNWATVTASCSAAPSATFVMRRSAEDEPTETSDAGAAASVMKPVAVEAEALVVLPEPMATLPA